MWFLNMIKELSCYISIFRDYELCLTNFLGLGGLTSSHLGSTLNVFSIKLSTTP